MVTVSENLELVSKLLNGSLELRRRSLQSPPWPAYSIPVRTAAETVALPRSKSFCRRAIYETYIDFTLCSEETDELEAEFVALRQKLLLRARATVSAAVRISDSARLGDRELGRSRCSFSRRPSSSPASSSSCINILDAHQRSKRASAMSASPTKAAATMLCCAWQCPATRVHTHSMPSHARTLSSHMLVPLRISHRSRCVLLFAVAAYILKNHGRRNFN